MGALTRKSTAARSFVGILRMKKGKKEGEKEGDEYCQGLAVYNGPCI